MGKIFLIAALVCALIALILEFIGVAPWKMRFLIVSWCLFLGSMVF